MSQEDTNELAKKQFGREASKYVSSLVHSSETDLDFVKEFIDPKTNWSMLDIATGAGHLALTIAPLVSKVVASDITREMLVETDKLITTRGLDNITTEEIDVHDIPYDNNTFDLVASRIAPHHFHDIDQAVTEMVRVCNVGGYIFIQDTVAPENEQAAAMFNKIEKLRDPSHVRDLSPNQWMMLLESKGCKIINQYTKPKDWPLRWWTGRMSTPRDKVEEIISLLEDIYSEYKDEIHIRRQEPYGSDSDDRRIDKWSLHPHNGYFLAQKI